MTFGSSELLRGVNFLVAVIGLFGISEILLTMEERLALRGHAAGRSALCTEAHSIGLKNVRRSPASIGLKSNGSAL
jgi:TctA family transporter